MFFFFQMPVVNCKKMIKDTREVVFFFWRFAGVGKVLPVLISADYQKCDSEGHLISTVLHDCSSPKVKIPRLAGAEESSLFSLEVWVVAAADGECSAFPTGLC